MQANQPSASPTGGRFSARVLAVVLALGVLGYLMWRSQARHDVAPARPPMLHSSKELTIEPDSLLPKPTAPEGQNPTASPAEATPAPEAPR